MLFGWSRVALNLCAKLPFVNFEDPSRFEDGSTANVSGVFVVMHTASAIVVAPLAYKEM